MVLHVAFVVDEPVFADVSAAVVRVHAVCAHGHGARDACRAAAVVFCHHAFADHAARLAHIELALPAVAEAVLELVPAGAPARDLPADPFRDARVVRERPHESLLVREVCLEDAFALGVRCLRPRPVRADEVARERLAVVGVRLAVRHLRVDPRRTFLPAGLAGVGDALPDLQLAQEQLVVQFPVAVRLAEGNAVGRDIGQAHAEAVRLYPAVAGAVRFRTVRRHAGQEAARRVAFHDVWIDAWPELVECCVLALDAVDGLAVDGVRLAADGIGDASRRHEVALVCGVDEHLAAKDASAFGPELDDSSVPLYDSAGTAVEAFAEDNLDAVARHPAVEDGEGCGRLERPHGVRAEGSCALAVRQVVAALLARPVALVLVPVGDGAVELERDAAERRLVADVRLAESAGGESAYAVRRLHDHRALAEAARLHRGGDSAWRAAVDHDVARDYRVSAGR